jgi:hypothetical protein
VELPRDTLKIQNLSSPLSTSDASLCGQKSRDYNIVSASWKNEHRKALQMRRYQQLSLDEREKMARLRQSESSIAEIALAFRAKQEAQFIVN